MKKLLLTTIAATAIANVATADVTDVVAEAIHTTYSTLGGQLAGSAAADSLSTLLEQVDQGTSIKTFNKGSISYDWTTGKLTQTENVIQNFNVTADDIAATVTELKADINDDVFGDRKGISAIHGDNTLAANGVFIAQLSSISEDALISGVAGGVVDAYNALGTAVDNLDGSDLTAVETATADLVTAGTAFSDGVSSATDLFATVETGVTRVEGSFAKNSVVVNGPPAPGSTTTPLDGVKLSATINGEDYSNYSDYVSSFVTGK